MSAERSRRARWVQPHCEGGFTLVEVLISVVVLAMVAGALGAALITSMSAATSSRQNLRESNDEQLVAAFFTRDVQSAGGLDPSTGGYDDSTLGVSVQDAAGCAAAGTLKLRVKWIDWTTTTSHTYVVIYSYADPVPQTAPPSKDLVRTTCVDSVATGASILATHLSTVVVPVVTCTGRGVGVDCKSNVTVVPDSVSMTLTSEDNNTYRFYGSLRVSDPLPPPPTVMSITSSGSTPLRTRNGLPEQGDTITITFSSAIGPDSVCSTWAPGRNSLSTTSTTVTLTANSSGDDTLAVADSSCALNIFRGGLLDLGTTGYVTGVPPTPPPPAIFGNPLDCDLGHHCSTVAIDASDTVLKITLGDLESGTVGTVPASPGITYNPPAPPDPFIASGSAIDPDPFF